MTPDGTKRIAQYNGSHLVDVLIRGWKDKCRGRMVPTASTTPSPGTNTPASQGTKSAQEKADEKKGENKGDAGNADGDKKEEKANEGNKEGEKVDGDEGKGEGGGEKKGEGDGKKEEGGDEKKEGGGEEKKEDEEKKEEEKKESNNKDEKKERKDEKKCNKAENKGDEEKMPYVPKELHWSTEDGKMMSTDNDLYSVKPVYAFLDKDEVVDIDLTRVDGGEAKADKIFLLYTPAAELGTDVEQLFTKEVSSYDHYTIPTAIDA
ncbi:unnamed protein product [Toxocara canis]|uniref:PITH domain-containing protein n=1 Tax=Toxocara canis TaxID=6265 RepID=A0A183TY74_TOXCA|nr:unnamed protein product [Toxocara canis]